uniref:Heat shock protein 40 n=1 Tax=Scrippsiella trochoidea TaxID=71861 RepID=A0A890C5L0_SCRTR|nr:heat shock protein 40 [Scrippsiella trochoidea]
MEGGRLLPRPAGDVAWSVFARGVPAPRGSPLLLRSLAASATGAPGVPAAERRRHAGRFSLAAGAVAFAGAVSAAISRRARHGRAGRMARKARGGEEDFYQVLGVNYNANDREIKSAFRRLARQYHPDVNKEEGAQDKFQQIARAYEVLSDGDKRRRYDQFGQAAVDGASASGPDMSGMDLDDILSDVFGSFFGGGMGGMGGMGGRGRKKRRRVAPERGADLQVEVDLPFKTGVFGADWVVQVRREERCIKCEGRGIKKKAKNTSCRMCNGAGVTLQVMSTPLGVMQTQQTCPHCGGSGTDPSAVCRGCRGKGTIQQVKEVSVAVPAGVTSGDQLRLKSEGDKGTRGGPTGDLYVTCKVQGSDEFRRKGFDIFTEHEISIFDAMLGTSLEVRTVDGVEEMEVPAGTQPDSRLRLCGHGVPKLGRRGERGDHIVSVKVEVPQKLSEKQRELAEQLRDAMAA